MKLGRVIAIGALVAHTVCAALVGVDYGQEYTKSVLVAPGVPFEILMTSDSKRKDVSGLALKPAEGGEIERIYGSASLHQCVKSPRTCLVHLKALLGQSVDDTGVAEYVAAHRGVTLAESKGHRNTVAFDMAALGVFAVEETLAMSLAEIKARAQDHLKAKLAARYPVADVVITVPPFFNQAQRRAVLDGAEIAGFNVVGLVDDGVAVAVNYVSSRQFDDTKQHHIVYDMGAGSTKATLFSIHANATSGASVVEVLGVGYDDTLGGGALTRSVRDILAEKFLAKNPKVSGKDFVNDDRAMTKLWQAAERAKTVLSANGDAAVSVESLYGDIDFKAKVSRDEFQEFNADLMSKVTKPILDIFESGLVPDLDVSLADVDSVILTGGSTRVPFVQKHLNALVGEARIAKNVNADESAVLGATLYGVILSNMFKAKEISVVEHSVSNYDAVVAGSESISVFPRGAVLGETVTVEFDGVDGDDFTVDLYEDGKLYQTQTFSGVKDTLASLNGSDVITYVGTFTLSKSRLFTLDKVQIRSEAKKNIMEKLFGDSGEEQETDQEALLEGSANSTESADSKPEKAPRRKTVTLSGKKVYAKQHPLSTYSKQASIERLKTLASKDSARRRRENLRNELEASLYSLRAQLEDAGEVDTSGGLVAEAETLVSTLLEWLDYDSDGASVADLKERLDDVKVMRAKMVAYSEFLHWPAEGSRFNALHKRALESMHGIQDVMLTMAEDASSLRQNLTVIGLDWEEENKKIQLDNLPPLDDKEVQMAFMSLNADLEELIESKLVQTEESPEDRTDQYSKEELFEKYNAVSAKIDKLDEFKRLLERAHVQRTSALKKVYRKNFAKKLKEAQAAAAAAAETAETADASPDIGEDRDEDAPHGDDVHDEL